MTESAGRDAHHGKDFAAEIATGARFEFGANWSRFLARVDDRRISDAMASLTAMLGVEDFRGRTVLDVGSGSGLFSLAARRLGAKVRSFDYDPQSVACTRELRRRYAPDDPHWTVERGSVLHSEYLSGLGQFDLVYSWGVLHHTGDMWQAFANVAPLVSPGGQLFIAVYNDQGFASRYWFQVKKLYLGHPRLRTAIIGVHMIYPFLPSLLLRAVTDRLREARGMSFWHDVVDWVGGFPFEVATPKRVVDFFTGSGFRVERVEKTERHGCNQFVFRREASQ